jgi:hypothetical protein
MAAADRTTTTFPLDETNTNTFRGAYVNPLRAAFVAGSVITKAQFDLLKEAIDTFIIHDHSVQDYGGIGEFGNNGPRTYFGANPRVSQAFTGRVSPGAVSANTPITASTLNAYVDACNACRDHVHIIEDQTG